MTWREYQQAGLHRLRQALGEHVAQLSEVDQWLAKCGRPPGDPLRSEVGSLIRHLEHLMALVTDEAQQFAPYRPGVDPWITRGLSARLRPDFEARGITDREG